MYRRFLPLLVPLLLSGCGRDVDRAATVEAPPADGSGYETQIRTPTDLRGLRTELTTVNGEPVTVACSTCHAGADRPMAREIGDLQEFHLGMTFEHGTNTCGSCHSEEHRDLLRLANGDEIPSTRAIELCAQCHGPQYRDYQHGSHGGMTGYWDLTRGPRQRNHCVDCHDPHAPAFPSFQPAPGPNDRLREEAHDH